MRKQSMDDINLAIVSGKRIIQAENLARNPEKPITVKAVKGARYVLAEGDSLTGPDTISIKRAGNNLQLTLQGENSDQPNLIIEDYYPQQGEIVGLGEDGQWHAFAAVSADHAQDPQALQDGEQSTAALDSTVLPPMDNLEVDSNALAFGMIALAAAAAVAALAVLVRTNSNDHHSSPPPDEASEEAAVNSDAQPKEESIHPEVVPDQNNPSPESPAAHIDNIQDDLGEQQGALLPNDVTDDTTPTLNGSNQQAGSVIEIRDNGTVLGTAIADSKGNWSFTPASPLPEGTHEFVVIVTDPDGAVSAPSDPAVIIIASGNAPDAALSLGDLLPPDSDLSSWAAFSVDDAASTEHHALSPADEASRLLDELLSSSHPLH
jgi:hypothetical protein